MWFLDFQMLTMLNAQCGLHCKVEKDKEYELCLSACNLCTMQYHKFDLKYFLALDICTFSFRVQHVNILDVFYVRGKRIKRATAAKNILSIYHK